MDRIIISNPFVSLVCMQVCAHKDCTHKEIEDFANEHNPTGISSQWKIVGHYHKEVQARPVQCDDHPDRMHFALIC